MTLSIHSWIMGHKLQIYVIQIWFQAKIFIYAAWNVVKILSARHLSHLRNWLHAVVVASRSTSSKRLNVLHMYDIGDDIFTTACGFMVWQTIGSWLLWPWRYRLWIDHRRLCYCVKLLGCRWCLCCCENESMLYVRTQMGQLASSITTSRWLNVRTCLTGATYWRLWT